MGWAKKGGHSEMPAVLRLMPMAMSISISSIRLLHHRSSARRHRPNADLQMALPKLGRPQRHNALSATPASTR